MHKSIVGHNEQTREGHHEHELPGLHYSPSNNTSLAEMHKTMVEHEHRHPRNQSMHIKGADHHKYPSHVKHYKSNHRRRFYPIKKLGRMLPRSGLNHSLKSNRSSVP